MNKPLAVAAIAEAATGVALVALPTLVGRLLFGVELAGVTEAIGRITGIALIALAVACWPGKEPSLAPTIGMTTYSLLVAIYLAWIGIRGQWVGPLLWSAVVAHIALTIGCAWGLRGRIAQGR